MAPLWNVSVFASPRLQYPELVPEDGSARKEQSAYDGIAEFWHDYVKHNMPDYASYITSLVRESGLEVESVLDLACGAGTLTARLASVFPDVVGLDLSEAMLAQARKRCADQNGVLLVAGDFRRFQLGRTFDAVVSACNSLNYVTCQDDLARTFQAVAEHLRPGGWFLFDTVTERYMTMISDQYVHSAGEAGRRFVIHFHYDVQSKRETSKVLLPSGVETHRRIPIDLCDIEKAIKQTDLEMADRFSSTFLGPGWGLAGYLYFFALRKRG